MRHCRFRRQLIGIFIAGLCLGVGACKVSNPDGATVLMRPNFPASKSFGLIDGREIGVEQLDNATRRKLHAMDATYYEARKAAFDRAVKDYVLLKEADRRGISVDDLLKHEVLEPSQRTADAEAVDFLNQHREQLANLSQEELSKVPELKNLRDSKDFSSSDAMNAVDRIVSASIKQRRQEEALAAYVDGLRRQADVREFLQPPPPLRQRVAIDQGPRRGAEKPSVEVVEFGSFSDRLTFQMEEELRAAAKIYSKQLAWGFRHLPRDDTPEVRLAHLYAYCAQQQDRFWEMHPLLIENWYRLNMSGLKDLAKKAGLQDVPLATCMDSTRGLQNTLDLDRLTAKELNVKQTPVFFVNGIMVSGLDGPEKLREVIELEAKSAYFIAAEKTNSK